MLGFFDFLVTQKFLVFNLAMRGSQSFQRALCFWAGELALCGAIKPFASMMQHSPMQNLARRPKADNLGDVLTPPGINSTSFFGGLGNYEARFA